MLGETHGPRDPHPCRQPPRRRPVRWTGLGARRRAAGTVALPSIGLAFDASQTALDLVAVGYALGRAASVLWLGALGDRFGRKLLLLLGMALSFPACIAAALAPTIDVLIAARLVGGVSAGLAYPTTLALVVYAIILDLPGRRTFGLRGIDGSSVPEAVLLAMDERPTVGHDGANAEITLPPRMPVQAAHVLRLGRGVRTAG